MDGLMANPSINGNSNFWIFWVQENLKRRCQWVDLRENLQETKDCPMKYGIFLQFFP